MEIWKIDTRKGIALFMVCLCRMCLGDMKTNVVVVAGLKSTLPSCDIMKRRATLSGAPEYVARDKIWRATFCPVTPEEKGSKELLHGM